MSGKILEVLKKHWGYDSFLPLQEEAMESVLKGRDSLVVLPTGGGKSLCYQVPAVLMSGMAVVVSPLISLMKDQVDALEECGVSAARLDSSLSPDEKRDIYDRINGKNLKLLYVSPERMVMEGFIEQLTDWGISFVAVDESHCVSMWGHDFRPEYRKLASLRDSLPDVAFHGYTATATEQVRNDIAVQLNLEKPEILVGSFDRPNLVYEARSRSNKIKQVCEVLDRHIDDSGIIYCIKRSDVDKMSEDLTALGYSVLPYHAGMEADKRRKNQDDFINERVNTIVATIAFGMGIDKSNVRYVIHTGMPKSLEHYQQESGRAGRDGLEAECSLIYSGGDFGTWSSIMRDMEPEAGKIALGKLSDMYNYCTGVVCRHKALINYFGQDLEKDNCGACDVCTGKLDCLEDSLITSQKIISCVARLNQRFGAGYTASVLSGSKDKRILENSHDELSTYGLLSDFNKTVIHDWIEQLVAQGYLNKSGEYSVLEIPEKGRLVLKGEETPNLLKPPVKKEKKRKLSGVARDSWEGVDRELFDELKALRSEIARRKGLPAYIVFSDVALRDMARRKPKTKEEFLSVSGVGEAKCKQYGETFIKVVRDYLE